MLAVCGRLGLFFAMIFLLATGAHAQVSASVTGQVTDPSGAAVVGAKVGARNVDTGAVREAVADGEGRYVVAALPVGNYEIQASEQGFKEEVRSGIHLVVGEEATVDLTLQVGEVNQEVAVSGDAPMVSVTTTDISGLVGEQQVKDLPLNGRSYDQLMTAESGRRQFHLRENGRDRRLELDQRKQFFRLRKPAAAKSVLAEWRGIYRRGRKQHAARRSERPIAGRGRGARIQRAARFLRRRIRQASRRASRDRDAVRHRTVARLRVEFLRNNDLDAPELFRRRLGAAVPAQSVRRLDGRADQKDKTFVFANYEGFRQSLHQTSETFVPDTDARTNGDVAGFRRSARRVRQQWTACAAAVTQLLNVWPVATPANCRDRNLRCQWDPSGSSGVSSARCRRFARISERRGVDHIFSSTDSLTGVYTDRRRRGRDGDAARSIQHRHRQPARAGSEHRGDAPFLSGAGEYGAVRLFARGYFFLGEPTPGTPAAAVHGLCGGASRWARSSWAAARRRIPRRNSAWRAATTAQTESCSGIFSRTKTR